MSISLDELLVAKRVLLLQGPVGPFFADLADWLISKNIECFKVNFNAGDCYFYAFRSNTWSYQGKADAFEVWLTQKLEHYMIDAVVCFGDCRYYHRIAKNVTQQLGKQFFVFEEGYIRPDYITFEQNGVNGYSNFSQEFLAKNNYPVTYHVPQNSHNRYSFMVWCGFQYYFFWLIFFWLYPFYIHHRGYHPLREACFWIISMWRRVKNQCVEPQQLKKLILTHDQQYFVFTLQVHNDSQVLVHSHYHDVKQCIEEVLLSFAVNANPEHYLVFKHHPMDRGYRHYGPFIQRLARQYGIERRVHYWCDVHLPTLLKHSLGLVTINSTTGIQALYHNIPVKTLGYSLYNLPGLTCQNSLDDFWKQPVAPDKEYFNTFRQSLIEETQLNGAYYGRNSWMV